MRLLAKQPLDDNAKSLVYMVQGSVGRMAGLISDVMDFARSRLGGGLNIDRRDEAPVEEALAQVADELRVSMPHRVIETEFALALPVNCDSGRIAQLASNLLSNALVHGAPDQPVRMTGTTSGIWFEVAVSNAGEPIPPSIRDSIFRPFARGAHRPNQEGLGLGLYIVQQIAEAHGGKMSVTSSPAETPFTFRMPLRLPSP